MKNWKTILCVALLPFMLACANHPCEDEIECAVEINWKGETYSATDADDSLREAREDAIEEACEIACRDVDSCENACERKAEVKSLLCKNRYSGEILSAI